MKTRKAKVQRFLSDLSAWFRRHRHRPLPDQHVALSRRLRGYCLYFGVNGNTRILENVRHHAERLWFKRLQRRSQRSHRLNWERFSAYLQAHPLPRRPIGLPPGGHAGEIRKLIIAAMCPDEIGRPPPQGQLQHDRTGSRIWRGRSRPGVPERAHALP